MKWQDLWAERCGPYGEGLSNISSNRSQQVRLPAAWGVNTGPNFPVAGVPSRNHPNNNFTRIKWDSGKGLLQQMSKILTTVVSQCRSLMFGGNFCLHLWIYTNVTALSRGLCFQSEDWYRYMKPGANETWRDHSGMVFSAHGFKIISPRGRQRGQRPANKCKH